MRMLVTTSSSNKGMVANSVQYVCTRIP